MKITEIRDKIDRLDEQVLVLLNRRARLAKKIIGLKTRGRRPAYDPAREGKILRRIVSLNPGPLESQSLRSVFREVISACRRLERELVIVYLGPEATFTHEAALKQFGSSAAYSPADSIEGVFLEVDEGRAEYGVVPIENSLEGAVSYTLDMFIDSELKICSELYLRVSHSLLSNSSFSRIRKLYSHPQVFGQCRRWLREHMPQVEMMEVASTAKAVRLAAREKDSAALASPLAAAVYGLAILAEKVEDSSLNITRFLVIGKKLPPRSGRDRSSILFALPHRAGTLHDALDPFKARGINLTRIESRPSKKKPWEYYFFVDLDGYVKDKKVKFALEELEKKCLFLKVLGSYPRA
jgi:chorismate mutase/prephenate dehydratase